MQKDALEGMVNGKKVRSRRNQMTDNITINGLYSDTERKGDPVVIIIATGSEVRGFKPGRGRWIFFRA